MHNSIEENNHSFYLIKRTGQVYFYLFFFVLKAFWITVVFATRVEFLYVGRFLGGLTGGGTFVCIPLFVAEIADDQ